MARHRSSFLRSPRRGRGSDLGGVGVLIAVGLAICMAKVLWPVLLLAAAVALLAYVWKLAAAKRTTGDNPVDQLDIRSTTHRVARGNIAIEVSLGPGRPQQVAAPVDPDSVWVSAGRSVTIAGRKIDGGLLYVGDVLPPVGAWRTVEPALINPTLPVADASADYVGGVMPYWPSYSDISPTCRAGYLEWLADGRRRPDANIGYVFLFFYGLERRLLADTERSAAARAEVETILGEIERLLRIYGENHSFRSYAGGLVDVKRVSTAKRLLYELPPPSGRTGYELPTALRVGIGQLIMDGKPIPVDWAWSWLSCHPEVYLRTPASRCSVEFRRLFERQYREKFGAGMILKPSKTKLALTYRPASSSFGNSVTFPVDDLPDVAALSAPVQKLREIAEQCTDKLDAYSRWLGRNPDGSGTLAAAALLPAELLLDKSSEDLDGIRQWLESNLQHGRESVTVPAPDLLRLWSPAAGSKFTRKDAVGLAQILAKLGYGLEPDVRFGGPALDAEAKAVIFGLSEGAPATPSPAYSAAILSLHLAATVATADGTVTTEETQHLEEHLESALHLSAPERQRLRSHLAWLLADRPGMAGLKKRVDALSQPQRRGLTQLLVAIAGADGHFDPEEITALTKIYRLLGFSAAEVYSDVHAQASSAPATEPITIRAPGGRPTGFVIPPPTPSESPRHGSITLDPMRIEAKLAETAAVSALLANVFVDEEQRQRAEPAETVAGTPVAGLDVAHSTLARELGKRKSWARAELDQLAATLDLLPDGALEKINDVAFEHGDEPFCEGDDPVEINANVAQELLA